MLPGSTRSAAEAATTEAIDRLLESVGAELTSLTHQLRAVAASGALSKELDCARAEAASRVRAAEAEAAALIAAAQGAEPMITSAAREPQNPTAGLTPRSPSTVAADGGGEARNGSRNGHVPGLTPAAMAPLPAPGRTTRRRGRRRFLYVDTVLPLVAVLIVLVVLFAWLG